MTILIAGDFCPQHRVATAFEKNDFTSVLEEVKNLTSKVDYSIVNFECPIGLKGTQPIEKQGPNLWCDSKAVSAIKYAGFDCVTLANNHFRDFGHASCLMTMKEIKDNGLDYVGGGENLTDAARILYHKTDRERIAIINCCEHEFSVASDKEAGSNPLNPIKQYNAIREARKNADYVLVIVHGGHEHFQLPSPRMIETYRFFIDVGADAVINHHQHCFSGYDIWNDKPIFYGLGNFCFDNPNKHSGIWTEGYMVTIDFHPEKVVFQIHPYKQCTEKGNVELLPSDYFDDRISDLNRIIADPVKLNKEIDMYYKSCQDKYSSIFEPCRNRFYLAARRRGWLPSLIGKKRRVSAANYILCESHRDKLIHWLSSNN